MLCVDLDNPTMRFFVADRGGNGKARLEVKVLYEALDGSTKDLTLANIKVDDAWQPSLVIPIGVNLLAVASANGWTRSRSASRCTGCRRVRRSRSTASTSIRSAAGSARRTEHALRPGRGAPPRGGARAGHARAQPARAGRLLGLGGRLRPGCARAGGARADPATTGRLDSARARRRVRGGLAARVRGWKRRGRRDPARACRDAVPAAAGAASRSGRRREHCSASCPSTSRVVQPPERVLVLLGSSWYALAPALVFVAAGSPSPSLDARTLTVVAVALVCQFALDLVSSALRERAALGVRPLELLAPLGWAFSIDLVLAPLGAAGRVRGLAERRRTACCRCRSCS